MNIPFLQLAVLALAWLSRVPPTHITSRLGGHIFVCLGNKHLVEMSVEGLVG